MPWLTLHWDEELRAPWPEVKGYAQGEEYRAGLNQVIALCRSKCPRRYLGDARYLGPVAQADQRWPKGQKPPLAIPVEFTIN